jgi:hypothetical protein
MAAAARARTMDSNPKRRTRGRAARFEASYPSLAEGATVFCPLECADADTPAQDPGQPPPPSAILRP